VPREAFSYPSYPAFHTLSSAALSGCYSSGAPYQIVRILKCLCRPSDCPVGCRGRLTERIVASELEARPAAAQNSDYRSSSTVAPSVVIRRTRALGGGAGVKPQLEWKTRTPPPPPPPLSK